MRIPTIQQQQQRTSAFTRSSCCSLLSTRTAGLIAPVWDLRLSGCSQLTAAFARTPSVGLDSIRSLSLTDLPLLSDDGLLAIGTNCPQLHTVDLSRCRGVRRWQRTTHCAVLFVASALVTGA
jgi:hypothetical protein